jgi:hypothetical protein
MEDKDKFTKAHNYFVSVIQLDNNLVDVNNTIKEFSNCLVEIEKCCEQIQKHNRFRDWDTSDFGDLIIKVKDISAHWEKPSTNIKALKGDMNSIIIPLKRLIENIENFQKNLEYGV